MCQSLNGDCRDKKDCLEIHKRDGFETKIYLDYTNSRLKVKDFSGKGKVKELALYLIDVAKGKGLGKILFNAREEVASELEAAGFVLEGKYPGFFKGIKALGYSYFVEKGRGKSQCWEKEEDILQAILGKKPKESSGIKLPEDLYMREAVQDDADVLADLYKRIFSTYPSPLLEQSYIKEVMGSHVLFAAIFNGDRLVSAASADMDVKNGNAEITDCATLPEYRGQGLLTYLIRFLEKEMVKRNINCLYSLARAGSYGMNASLYNLGYYYSGRFINNCHIGGRYEDMNLWIK